MQCFIIYYCRLNKNKKSNALLEMTFSETFLKLQLLKN